jgi:alpha-galactosidase
MSGMSALSSMTLGSALLVLACACEPARKAAEADHFQDLIRVPDAVTVVTENGAVELARAGAAWKARGIEVGAESRDGGLRLELSAPEAAVKSINARWNGHPPADWKYLGDAWERSYGELEWQPLDPAREMPWYFLASDGKTTHGYGVMTQPAAMCSWTADADGITLTADLRSGGAGVRLAARRLSVCTVTSRRGNPGETPFETARVFCRRMCPSPRLPKEPVYGFNDWYCDYGKNSAGSVLYYAAFVARLAPKGGARPFMVVDDGWQATGGGTGHGGPWDRGNASFPSMAELAAGIRRAGARPGIWIHLLTAQDGQPDSWRLKHDPGVLDISVPEVRAYVKETVARLRDWGYDLIKHDYSVADLAGYTRAAPVPEAEWVYADRSRTAAEIVLDHYRSIREAAGEDAIVIGCNTIGHLAAGLFELQRIGDDTSGRDWSRVRNRGVNTIGFRAPQHGAFFAVDADCVGLTEREAIPWTCNRQWLDLLARSGTPLFISFKKDALTEEQEKTVAEALAIASRPRPLGEPLDWFEAANPTRGLEAISHLEGGAAPRRWKLMGKIVEYDWTCQPAFVK